VTEARLFPRPRLAFFPHQEITNLNDIDLLNVSPEEANALVAALKRMRLQKMPTNFDIHHPESSPDWPRYQHQEWPLMVYHPIKLDPKVEAERKGVMLRNQRNPMLPALDVPPAQPLVKIVRNKQELEEARKDGWLLKPVGGQMALHDGEPQPEPPAPQRVVDPLAELAAGRDPFEGNQQQQQPAKQRRA
jgi:hypothetical protein